VEQKDQKIRKYEDGSDAVIGVLTYMKLLTVAAGLLVNFNVTSLREGRQRLSLPPIIPS
jgi:hypothetical protein